MTARTRLRSLRIAVPIVAGALFAGALAFAPPTSASVAGDALVINEVYVNGGSSGATYKNKFIELYNPTSSAIGLGGLSLQYRSATGTGNSSNATPLTGSVAPHKTFLVGGPSNADNGADLPTPDQVATGLNTGGAGGTVSLVDGTAVINPGSGSTINPAVIDLIGWGTSNTFESAGASGNSVTKSLARNATGADTDTNATDFQAGDPTPTNAAGEGPPDQGPPTEHSIAEIQGTGDSSQLAGQPVITDGVVTAAYNTGGFNGFYIQTAGSGGDDDATPGASDAVFVYGSAAVAKVEIGDNVEVTGSVSEFNGLTEVTSTAATDVVVSSDPAAAVKPTDVVFPDTDAKREALEGMLLEPQGDYTVTDNYSTNQYAEVGLAVGDKPLYVPTEVARPGTPERDAVIANNAAKKVVLDDGASTNFLTTGKDIPLPWLTTDKSLRIGAKATFTKNVVLDYRNSAWKFQPLEQMTADDTNGVDPVAFSGAERPAAPEEVGGDIKLGSFNVLNYFNTTGADYTAATGIPCTYYDDRDGNHVTVNSCTGDAGPRGAADAANLKRQQDKIVNAINHLGADVVSLEEIENSVKFGLDRDDALQTLVAALNADAGAGTWDYAKSPGADGLPPTAEQDVIRTAFIYKPAKVRTVGASTVLVGSAPFADAREPLAQAFEPVDGTDADEFVAIVNHFKSKGSGDDDGTGQGNANPDRVAQAHALVSFADDMKTKYATDKVYLSGDFNAYSMEDPVQVLKDAGYVDLEAKYTEKETYLFGGEIGSLDHIFASPDAAPQVTGLDVWNINAFESVAYEYSRDNYNVTDFYSPGPYRASDHDPVLVGIKRTEAPKAPSRTTAASTPGLYGLFGPVVLAHVKSNPRPTGTVAVSEGNKVLASVRVGPGGTTVAPLSARALTPGTHTLTVTYSGDDAVASSRTTIKVTVIRLW